MADPKIVYITGKITTEDGIDREFAIGPMSGSMQWGATTEQLGHTVDALGVMLDALVDGGHLANEGDNEREVEASVVEHDLAIDDELTREEYLEQYPHDEHVGLDDPFDQR